MEISKIILSSLGSIVTLFFITKFLGYRQMSQMSMFDYINGITIGSIAAEVSTKKGVDFFEPITAMIVYAIVIYLLSYLTSKSICMRRLITGKPFILYEKGTIYFDNFKKAKIDLGEFLVQCRNNGYFDLSKIQTVILESNGKVSILPLSGERPATPTDLKLSIAEDFLVANVIIDGHLMKENLKHTGKNVEWVEKEMHHQGIDALSSVLLATCDMDNNIIFYKKMKDLKSYDILE